MLYRFKSRATGDLIMLEEPGRRVLEIVGKDPAQAGIIQPQEVPAAAQALNAAAAAEPTAAGAELGAQELYEAQTVVPLAARVAPLLDMLRRSSQAGEPVVWFVE